MDGAIGNGTGADLALMRALVPAVRQAGAAILAIRAAGPEVERKADSSPVTDADRAAEAILLEALAGLAPGIPVIAEEEAAAGRLPEVAEAFFLVDPLDGTKDFIRGGPDFTVNVGLVRGGAPVAGIVQAPAQGRLWYGAGGAAFLIEGEAPPPGRPIRARPPGRPLEIVASRSHRNAETDAFIARFPGAEVVSFGSSLKFCALAEGCADLYPRLGPISQWDTAAGDAVLRAAGGRVLAMDGAPLRYGPTGAAGSAAFASPWFVATAGLDPFG